MSESEPIYSFQAESGLEIRVTVRDGDLAWFRPYDAEGQPVGEGIGLTMDSLPPLREAVAAMLDVVESSTGVPVDARHESGIQALALFGDRGVPMHPKDYPDLLAALDALER